MDFNDNKPIYKQIVDYCFGCIMTGAWPPGQRIPSVRELAVAMTVNTHTVLKAFEYMQAHEVIYPRRGMGYFLADDAQERVTQTRRQQFFEETLPKVIEEMQMLNLTAPDILPHLPQ